MKSTVCVWPRLADTTLILLCFETFCFRLDRVRARLQLREVEPACVVGCCAFASVRSPIRDRDHGAWHSRAAFIVHLADDRAGSFTLGEGDFAARETETVQEDQMYKRVVRGIMCDSVPFVVDSAFLTILKTAY